MPVRLPDSLVRLTLVTSLGALGLTGCQALSGGGYGDSLPPASGAQPLTGLAATVSVRRNEQGMPLIESHNVHDALFALGYVHASDRVSQMLGLRALAEGRLAERFGPGLLDTDRFMRAANLRQRAATLYRTASPRLRQAFEVYARGVNAWLYRYRDRLPPDLAGVRPEYWKPEDSALLFCLMDFSLSVNLREELAALALGQKVGADRLPWLLPTYPDEPLPFEEADKLKGVSLSGQVPGLASLTRGAAQAAALSGFGTPSSSNWAIAGSRTRSGKPMLANDVHLPMNMPAAWSFVQLRTAQYQVAGAGIAGIPMVLAGFNGRLAWGMASGMGDGQDLFLEQVKREGNRLLYLADGQWLPARERYETFLVKGASPVREAVYETRHGPLLNSAPGEGGQPALSAGYGLALKTAPLDDDRSLDALFNLSRADSLEKAFEATREIRAVALNMVVADAQSIGWQVTGRYPYRREGLGLMPSPGWDGRYDWDGFADAMLHPYDQDPPQGWLGSANQRSVARGYGMQLSSSWLYPERHERLAELAGRPGQDARSGIAMQYDQTTPFVAKLKAMLRAPGMEKPLRDAIAALPEPARQRAGETLRRLLAFDGRLAAESADAALYEAFLTESARQTFLDELGGDESPAWQALVQVAGLSYSAQADHVLGREDSPFWDDVATALREDKPAILARSLAAAGERLERQPGSAGWGTLHRYAWTSATTRMAPALDAERRTAAQVQSGYLDRGPYPAGGDHTTLNVAGYAWGTDFATTVAPAMRLLVDFGQDEPMLGQTGTGQSGNPASPHYADGLDAWRQGRYLGFPFKTENLDKVYGKERLLLTPEAN